VRPGRSLMLGIALMADAMATAPGAGAQTITARFEIASVGDSTFTFAIGPQSWVARRRTGIVVDPTRRDAQVARFRILNVTDGVVTALVTGQTALITTQNVVVLSPPAPPPWHKRGLFWGGAAAGALLGLIVGGALF
jgi:hypothetical protein